MKIRFWVMAVCLVWLNICPLAWAAEEGAVKSGIRSIMSGIVSTGKNVLSGVGEGIDEGRKGGESADKASLVTNKEDFDKLLSAKVIKAEYANERQVLLTIAIQNDNEQPVRITNLADVQSLVLIDADGFSHSLPNRMEQGKDVTALGKSLTRLQLKFTEVEAKPVTLRLFDIDLAVPEPVATVAE